VDSGYEQEIVYRWVVESGEGRFLACKGYGSSSRNGLWRSGVQSSPTRQVGNDWRISLQPSGIRLVEIHGDTWKAAVHDGWAAPHGAPGSITLFHGRASDPALRVFARQIVAEQREMDTTPGKEIKIKWVVMSKQNHYLDCCQYARAAADICGIRLVRVSAPVKSGPVAPPRDQKREVSSTGERHFSRNY
jgi:phage terminase large subunit GpA-like protein